MSGTLVTRNDHRLEEAKTGLLEQAAARAGDAGTPGGAPSQRVLALYYRRLAAEDVVGREPRDVAGATASHLELAAQRPAGTALVRVLTPDPAVDGWAAEGTVVEVVCEDMPFLVDSVTAELTRHGHAISLVVHPILKVRRDAVGGLVEVLDPDAPDGPDVVTESFIHVEIERIAERSECERLRTELRRVLEDVRAVVEDWPRMVDRARALAGALAEEPPKGLDPAEVEEVRELLCWMVDDHFTFIGARDYDLLTGDDGDDGAGERLASVPGTGLGILRDAGLSPVVRNLADLTPEGRAKALEPHLLTLTKANSVATVHRPAYLDYVGIKRFDDRGQLVGERRFLGLFSASAYNVAASSVPVVRRKIAEVVARAGFEPSSHDAKDLLQILETYPRDELFAITTDDLAETAMGILRLQERRRVRLFARRDDYGRYISCLVFLPRERYTTAVRLGIQDILVRAFHGTSVDYTTRLSESVLARLHLVIHTEPGDLPDVDLDEVQRALVAVTRSWEDDFTDAVRSGWDDEQAEALLRRYAAAFPEAYKEDFDAATAVTDVRHLERLTSPDDIGMLLHRPPGCPDRERRFKLYRIGPPLSLSRVMPLLSDMGVEVVDERPYALERRGADPAWVYDFGLRRARGDDDDLDADGLREAFQDAFAAVWSGRMDSDAFNGLVLGAGLTWREVSVLRAYAKYLRQAGTKFSQSYIEATVLGNLHVARLLVDLFEARFDPARTEGAERESAAIVEEIESALDAVASLDEDRILRSYLRLVLATVRTNAFQRPAGRGEEATPYLSFKLDPAGVPDLPEPRPAAEIFVCSPRLEGVHLRFGPVARGGIRWSDRREDFRTEVLGLVKAQMVKNSVIVPVGAKGGFVVKQPPPDEAGREALLGEVIACYRTFIRGLLDLTDNLVDGRVVPPERTVRHDGDDPYLVVAADKGTATFSDLANAIAAEYDFWLGDAFASGGSAGYDHKAMGITARGAWESVKRHFRDLGIDVQREDVTVVGVGDMSGDVFGNGMLLSRHLRLLAAFDHRHIFLDPDPDAETSWRERKRLFDLPRSTWADYDQDLISAGGGVWPRIAKSIPVSKPVRAALGIDPSVTALTPAELVRAILLAPVDLLWNGGIGTYVKAESESHADAGDKTNDAVRVDGRQLRARVVGEGGNLGFTQLGRIEFALAGGLVNTDFIDNSAGVDTSDHEVNIKILLDTVVADGELDRDGRDELLAAMTDEVADLVLRDNYEQTVALGNACAQAASLLHVHERYITDLERRGYLDRTLEFLPDTDAILARRSAGVGLTAPELAVLLAWTKISLTDAALDSDLPEDAYFGRELERYFPHPLRERYADRMPDHRLRREIVATAVVNQLVNRAGITYAYRIGEETAASFPDVVRAYAASWESFDLREVWDAVERLDNAVPSDVQTTMFLESRKLLERATRWMLHNRRPPLDVDATVAAFRPGIRELDARLSELLAGGERAAFDRKAEALQGAGVPAELARRVAGFEAVYAGLDVTAVAESTGRPVGEVSDVYFALDEGLQVGRLRERINGLPRDDRWHTLARASLRDDLYTAHAALTAEVLQTTESGAAPAQRLQAWTEQNPTSVERAGQVLQEIEAGESFDLATLSVALRQIRSLTGAAGS